MTKKSFIAMTLILLAGALRAAAGDAGSAPVPPKPAEFEAASVTLTATVEKIDEKTRSITLKTPDGKLTVLDVGPEVTRFNEIKKGDHVTAVYLESVGIVVQPPSETMSAATGSSSVIVRNMGKKPSGRMVDTDVVTATVVKIDAKKRKITLRGPAGNTFHIHVAPDVQHLENVKKGDQVLVKYTRTIAIDVHKS